VSVLNLKPLPSWYIEKACYFDLWTVTECYFKLPFMPN